ncbi:sigma-70 family RNA polymerase sigma factor [Sandaracinobacteroides saxicola]|uniref:Sigma-70 family RNA polymerase sigma factor n=2 Tax=Sandaracinobacteroides saxicola TaxID=2759707 RepID=A0A7G5IMA4_9SPHN|nr:sigma-70 family RNA polymerase sigma factor [Sandaracinobacteroides saxicola]
MAPVESASAELAPAELAPAEFDRIFRALMLKNVPALRAFARLLCGNRDTADDVVQDTLMRAWAARASFRLDSNFRAWSFRILRNHYFSLCRKSGRMTSWDPDAAERLLISPAGQETALHMRDFERGLATLSPEQREALLLVNASGMPYEEVAEVTGCAVGTVKSRVARARAALTRYLDGPKPADRLPLSDRSEGASQRPSRPDLPAAA